MPLIDESFEGGLDEAVKRFESRLLERLYPAFPSTRQLAKRLGVSHTAIANKLREYGIGQEVTPKAVCTQDAPPGVGGRHRCDAR